MKLDFESRDRLLGKVKFLNQYRQQVDTFTEQIELAELSREAAAREADQIESEIADLLRSVARPAVVIVDGVVYELVDEPLRRPVTSSKEHFDNATAGRIPSTIPLPPLTRFRPAKMATVVT